MSKTISIGELRQNPTRMLREVKAGATYTVTDHGEPVAEIAARRQPRWVPSEEIDSLLRELGADDAWAQEIATDRERARVEALLDRAGWSPSRSRTPVMTSPSLRCHGPNSVTASEEPRTRFNGHVARPGSPGFGPVLGAGIPFDDAGAEAYQTVCGLMLASGREVRGRGIDLMIAATAAAHGAAVITRDMSDFSGLEGLVTVVAA